MSTAASAWLSSALARDTTGERVSDGWIPLPQRGEQEQPQQHSSAPSCSQSCQAPRAPGAPLGEGDFGTQSPVFSRNHKLKELCSLETENLIS